MGCNETSCIPDLEIQHMPSRFCMCVLAPLFNTTECRDQSLPRDVGSVQMCSQRDTGRQMV